jgi:hypothetical protein
MEIKTNNFSCLEKSNTPVPDCKIQPMGSTSNHGDSPLVGNGLVGITIITNETGNIVFGETIQG